MSNLTGVNPQEVVTKWTTGKRSAFNLNKIQNYNVLESTALVLENIETRNVSGTSLVEESVNTSSVGSEASHKPISIALGLRVIPNLFAHKLVGVQPLSTPAGYAYAVRTVYADGTDTEAGFTDAKKYSGYTGGYKGQTYTLQAADVTTGGFALGSGLTAGTVVTVDNATTPTTIVALGDIGTNFGIQGTQGKAGSAGEGVAVRGADGELWNMDSTGNNKWPELEIRFSRRLIEAGDRRLAAKFSANIIEDIASMHNYDVKLNMIKKLQYETAAELDSEIVTAIQKTAVYGDNGGDIAVVDVTDGATGVVDLRAKTARVVNAIITASNVVANKTKRGPGNFAIVSSSVASVLQTATTSFTAVEANVNGGINLSNGQGTAIGILNNTMVVYLDQNAGSFDYALVGFKGEDTDDCGVIFSPYIMNVVKTAVSESDFSDRVGVRSRYAVTTSLLGAGGYYRLLRFTGLSTISGIGQLRGWN